MENRKWKIEKWKMTFTELYEQFVPVKRLEVKTSSINRYRMDWKYLEPKIGATDIAAFKDIARRLDGLAAEIEAAADKD